MDAVDTNEAREVLGKEMAALTHLSYRELVDRLLNKPQTFEVLGSSGTRYQIELQAMWDCHPNGILRVLGCVDDSGWRAFAPVAESLLVAPDGQI